MWLVLGAVSVMDQVDVVVVVDPREVKDLDATAEEGKCTEPRLRVKWNTLKGRDRRGVIQNYTLLFRVSHVSHLILIVSYGRVTQVIAINSIRFFEPLCVYV